MIAPETDDGVLSNAAFFQRLDEQIHLRVDIRNASRIAVDQLALLGFRNRPALRNTCIISQLARIWDDLRLGRTAKRKRLKRGNRKCGTIIQVPVFFWRNEWQMGLVKAHSQEKGLWLLGESFDLCHRRSRHGPVEVGVVGHVAAFRGWARQRVSGRFLRSLLESLLGLRILVAANPRTAGCELVLIHKWQRPGN